MKKVRIFLFFSIIILLTPTLCLSETKFTEKAKNFTKGLKKFRTDVQSYGKFKFFGFTHQQFIYDKTAGENHGSNYRSARFRLGIIGNPTEKIDYFLLTEWGRLTRYDPVTLLDAWIQYTFSPLIKIKLGQTWYKFSLDGTVPLPDNPFIIRPKVIDGIWLSMGRNGNYSYDKGIEISGESKINNLGWGYIFSVTTGNGIDDHQFDDNNKRDLCGRIYFRPTKFFQIGASGFYGYSRTEATANSGTTKEVDVSENAFGFEAKYQIDKFRLIAEYLKGHYDDVSKTENGITYDLTKTTPRGYYITGGILIKEWLEFLLRYDYYEENSSLSKTGLKTTTLGLNFYFHRNNNRNKFSINYLFRNPEDNYSSQVEDYIIVQFQLMF